MTNEATPGALGSNDGLGPLPEPDVPLVRGGCYTAALVRQIVEASVSTERERFAKLCETWMHAAERESGPEAAGWLHQIAQHMRRLGPNVI